MFGNFPTMFIGKPHVAELGNNCFNVIATGIVSQDGYIQVGLSPNENFTNILHALYTYPSTIAP